MIFPDPPKKGDQVGLIAPCSPVTPDEAAQSIAFLESRGYRVVPGASVTAAPVYGYCAGCGDLRGQDIHRMFGDPEIRAVFCLRGGDSGNHVLDKLDYDLIQANPKVFMGYSDITNFHVAFNQRAHLITFHGPMVKTNMIQNFDPFTEASMEKALSLGATGTMDLDNPPGVPFTVLRPGNARGLCAGGNLSIINSLMGTPNELDTKGKILFFEEVDEDTAHVDRFLHQLKYAGKFADAAGILIGDFANQSNKHDPSYLVEDLMRDFFADYDKPVLYDIKSGHCTPMSTIPLGAVCTMDTGSGILRFSLE